MAEIIDNEITTKLHERAADLLQSGAVTRVIGWEAGRYEHWRVPVTISDVSQVGRLVYDEYCAPMIAKYALRHRGDGRVALVARGCESRAIERFIADHQLKREDVYLLGVGCAGMLDRESAEQLKKCYECQRRNPVTFDEMLTDEAPEPRNYRFGEVDRVEAMDRENRRAFFDRMFSSCIRCYACRSVCPVCTCRECFVDSERAGWQGKEFNLDENRYWGIIRAFHTSDRCIECGECERVCPMGLPLMTLMHKQVRDIDRLFGPYEGGGLTDTGPDPLRTYKTDDVEEFM